MSNKSIDAIFGAARNDDIEILRGVAILLVLVDHILAYCNIGAVQKFTSDYLSFWGGVDLFFALSGYVIGMSLLKQENIETSYLAKIEGLGSFWIKRVWRLWPAAWFWLFVPYVLVIALMPQMRHGDDLRAMTASVIGGVLNVVNIQEWHFKSGFGMHNLWWGQYWSLSLEEQFYLFIAPMMLFLPRRYLAMIMGLVIVLQFPLLRPAASNDLWWFIRSDAFAWGILIALFQSNGIRKILIEPTILARTCFALPAFLLALLALTATQLLYSVPFDVGLMAAISGALVFIASYDKGYLGIHGMLGRILSWMGDRSYTIYLIHGMVIVALLRVGPLSRLDRGNLTDLSLITGAMLLITLVLAEISYRFIEIPARLYGRKLSKQYQARMAALQMQND